ncbi:hypothetical protein SAMN00790413_03780 [Deinococcus hopiensis KR-140]|uniref:Uncharacterized protein n=1 Tax=Deinococcus hopiensis KR-140 TaxID=695939 RepID=A0A1W1UZ56_9DEIO|nr:hypothetical protein SAMN00790413_03780 [Deinococcus hopiensis KR-140]
MTRAARVWRVVVLFGVLGLAVLGQVQGVEASP